MSSFSLKSDICVRVIANTKVAQLKTYAIDCNHEIIARDQEIVNLRGGIFYFYYYFTFFKSPNHSWMSLSSQPKFMSYWIN